MEIEIGGNLYRLGQLSAREQFHVVRRLAPVIGGLVPAMQDKSVGAENLVEALGPIADAIAHMSDEDADRCIFGLLRAVIRKQPKGAGWSPITTPGGGTQIMFDDITMEHMLRLAWEVLKHNLSGFFAALPSTSPDEAPKPSAT